MASTSTRSHKLIPVGSSASPAPDNKKEIEAQKITHDPRFLKETGFLGPRSVRLSARLTF